MNRQLIKHPKVKLERLRREVVQKALQAYKASVYQQQWNNRKGAEQADQENGNDEDDDDDGESSGVIVVDRAEESDSVVKRVMIEPDLALQDEIQLGSAGGIGGSSSGGAVARVEPMDDRHSASSEDDEVVFVKRTKAGLSSPPTSGEGSGGDARKKSRKDRGLKPKRVDASRLLQAVETESEETEEEEEEEEEEASPLSIGKKRSLKNGDSQSLVKVGLKKDVGWSSSVKPDNFNQSEIVPTLLIKKIDDFENINCSGAPTNGKKDKNISSSSRSRSSSVSAVSSSYSNLSSKSNSNASSPGTNGYNDTSGQKNPRKRLALSPGAASNSSSSSSSGHNHQHTHESNASKAFKKKR